MVSRKTKVASAQSAVGRFLEREAEQDAKDTPSSSTGTAQESCLRLQEKSKYCATANVDIC